MAPQIFISRGEAKHIARLPKYRGQEYLAKKLHLGYLDEEDLKSGLIVDYFYDVLQYSTNRGLPWSEVAQSIHFALEIIQQCQGLEFPETVRLLQETATAYIQNHKLSLQSAKLLCQYFTTSFLAHYRLYQYVLTQPQEQNQGNITLTVECPPQIMKLSTAETLQTDRIFIDCHKAVDRRRRYDHLRSSYSPSPEWRKDYAINTQHQEQEWEYANKMRAIDLDEADRKEKLNGKRQETQVKSEDSDYEMKIKYLEGDLQSIAINDAEKLISELASDKLSFVKQDVAHNMTELQDTADIAIARQSVKVPQGHVNPQTVAPKGVAKPKSSVSRKSSSSNTSKKKK